MKIGRTPATQWWVLLTLSCLVIAGCGKDKNVEPALQQLVNDSPENAMRLFEASFEQERLDRYQGLFTADFRFLFSAAMDPLLVQKFGTSWDRVDEIETAQSLFEGLRDAEGNLIEPQALWIQLTLAPLASTADPDHPDSTAHYKLMVFPALHLEITTAAIPEPKTYVIDGRYAFHLVRGDAAVLALGQAADSNHWYIRRWEDQSSPPASSGQWFSSRPTEPWSWGRLKSQYHSSSLPAANPATVMARFEAAYEGQSEQAYATVFTDDFRFLFSGQTDPDLVQKYSTNWGRAYEVQSAGHLFGGFVDEFGYPQAGATSIALNFGTLTPADDPVHADSSAYYKLLYQPTVSLEVTTSTSPEPTTYLIGGRHAFYLVRGDAAVLPDGQRADPSIWYVRLWEDRSVPEFSASRPTAVRPRTWGSLKDQYIR